MSTEPTKMHGGLIKKQPRVTKDRNGNVTTEHFSGRKDVTIQAGPLRMRGGAKSPGGDS
jgi:hypothetical protein